MPSSAGEATQEELRWLAAADDLIAQSVFARLIASEKVLFSRQLKSEIRASFGIDKKFFAEADAAQFVVFRNVVAQRLIALIALVALLLLPSTVEEAAWFGVVYVGALLGSYLVEGFISERRVRSLTAKLIQRYQNILGALHQACAQIGSRPELAREIEMSGNWCKIALWQAKRAEYFDRYQTTVFWKIRSGIRTTSWAYLSAVMVISAGWAWFQLGGNAPASSPMENAATIFAIQSAVAALGWLAADFRKDDKWTDFLANAAKEVESHHPFELLEGVVRFLVARARDRVRIN